MILVTGASGFVGRAAEGDFRDWDRIREWAGTIAIELGES